MERTISLPLNVVQVLYSHLHATCVPILSLRWQVVGAWNEERAVINYPVTISHNNIGTCCTIIKR